VNFLLFRDSDFTFHPSLNLIVGANASGKSSLLAAIQMAVADGAGFISPNHTDGISDSDVRFETRVTKGRVRFEQIFPAKIAAKGTVFNRDVNWSITRERSLGGSKTSFGLYRAVKAQMEDSETAKPFVIPLIAFYGPHRMLSGEPGSIPDAAIERPSRIDGNEGWWDALVNLRSFERWIIGKTLERLQVVEEGGAGDSEETDELSVVNRALHECIPGATGIKYDLRLREIMIGFGNGQALPFSSLSDGQKGIVALIADIARRMCILNPFLGSQVLSETNGILAIDELDIHLHPGWQRRIIKSLRQSFPKLQIFATCHSPQMIGGLHPDEVLIMRDGQETRAETTYGLNANQVLEEVLEIGSREPGVEDRLHSVLVSVEAGDLELAQTELARIKTDAPQLPDYARIEALIHRKRVIGR
jgi:predicted ATP-binding protein involved in virulence